MSRDAALQCGGGPIARVVDELVLHRIVMNVIEMVLQVGCIVNHMLPIPPLPDAAALLVNA
jgi:hypothetical protein